MFWQVGSSATLGTGSLFAGNILAFTSITVTTGVTLTGRALARNGAVTLDTSSVTAACAVVTPPVCPTITLTPPTTPNGAVGVAYSQMIAATGGTGPYSFSLAAGVPPAGLGLAASGLLSGTPTAVATSNFTVRAVDVNSCGGMQAYTLVVAGGGPGCPAITLTPASPPNGTVGVAYSQTIVGSGGTGPYTFTVSTGTLPAGLTLSTAGVLAGTPTAGATSSFTMRGTDANGCFAEAAVTMLIATPVPTLPQAFFVLLALGLAAAGYVQLRYRRRAG